MGSKTEARDARCRPRACRSSPARPSRSRRPRRCVALADEIGYPLIDQGGGGRRRQGHEARRRAGRGRARLRVRAAAQGQKYFADAAVYVERYLEDPRHVEVQVLADAHGNVIHLGERDCTIQRRHQKLIEETPSPAVDDALRARIGADRRRRGARRRLPLGRDGRGAAHRRTGDYFFMEMNTRIQVEHTVTEMVTGLDLVREQILDRRGRAALADAGRRRAARPRDRVPDQRRGRRARASCPRPGAITAYREPAGPGVRVDSGVGAGDEISGLYDPMIAKLIVHDVDREQARRRMLRALDEFPIEGPPTLVGFHRALLEHPCFVAGETCHGVVESEELAERAQELDAAASCSATGVGQARRPGRASGSSPVEVDGRALRRAPARARAAVGRAARRRQERAHERPAARAGGRRRRARCRAPCSRSTVADGDAVEAGQVLCVVEAMKMENEIAAHRDGIVTGSRSRRARGHDTAR